MSARADSLGDTSNPTPAENTALFILDDAGVVFSETTQDIYAFNTAATYIWCQVEEALPRDEIAAAYAETFSCAADEARAHVEQALSSWRELGLLAGSAKTQTAEEEPPPPRFDPSTLPAHFDPDVVAERHYRVARSLIRVRFTSAEQESCVHPMLAHLETEERSDDQTVIDVISIGEEMALYRDREAVMDCPHIGLLAHKVKGMVWQTAVLQEDYLFDFHAGVVGTADRCRIFPAAAGSGKSTLTAALCHAGLRYLSDEIALLDGETFRARPMPLSLCVKNTPWELMTPLFPQLADLPSHERMDGKVVKYLPPPQGTEPVAREGLPATAVIFPKYDPEAKTELIPLAKNEALRRLLAECVVISTALDLTQVEALVNWIKRADTFDLPTSSLPESVDLILDYCRRT